MTSKEVQYALTYSVDSPFYFRSHIVIPNIRDPTIGFTHELDLLSISMETHIGTEIEIKASKSDIKRDLEKKHLHYDERVRQLYFAGSIELYDAFFEYVPVHAGIITVYKNQCTIRRRAKTLKSFIRPFSENEVFKIMRLGAMRYWSLFGNQFK